MNETTLGGNQPLSDWKSKQMKWKDEPYTIADEKVHEKITTESNLVRDAADQLTLKPF